jgi:WD40 repeat protein
MRTLLLSLAAWSLLLCPISSRAADDKDAKKEAKPGKELPPAATVQVDYAKDIEPILTSTCIKCHGPEKQKSGYRLDSREAAIKGGENGVAMVAGKSAESPLIRYIAQVDDDIKMPPPKAEPLTAAQVGLLRAWIDQGVKWTEKVVEAPKPKEYLPLKGQTSWVTSVAYAPDGSTLATAGGHTLVFKPGEVKLWDLKAGKEKAALPGHSSTVWSVAFDREGKRLATASYDKSVKIWDASSGKELSTIKGHANWVTCVAFSPDGALLVTGSEDTTAKLWDASSGAEKATLKGHGGTVRSAAFSPNGKMLATASFDNTIKIWDTEKAAELSTLKGHENAVWSVAFSPDGATLASGSADGTVKLWTVPDGGAPGAFAEKATLKGHKNWVSCVVFSRDGKQLASGGFDKRVTIWDLAKPAEFAALEELPSTVWSLSFSPDSRKLAIASGLIDNEEGTVKIWSLPVRF